MPGGLADGAKGCVQRKGPGGHSLSQQPLQQEGGHRQEGGKILCPPCCAPGCPQHRSQTQAPVHRRADFPFPTPLSTPGKTCSLDHHCIVYSSNMLHLESCPGAEPRTSDTASLYSPCPNVHDPSCILLPLNPCVDPFHPCYFFPGISLRSKPSHLAPSLAASILSLVSKTEVLVHTELPSQGESTNNRCNK